MRKRVSISNLQPSRSADSSGDIFRRSSGNRTLEISEVRHEPAANLLDSGPTLALINKPWDWGQSKYCFPFTWETTRISRIAGARNNVTKHQSTNQHHPQPTALPTNNTITHLIWRQCSALNFSTWQQTISTFTAHHPLVLAKNGAVMFSPWFVQG